ncbi:MAG: MMPL family transporter [Lachnospiraceae bacterium]|nr:MMPL family transporter [Lachnospiraceae bacterium]
MGISEKKNKKNIADFIVDHNRIIAVIVLILVVLSLFVSTFVGINYDLTTYLQESAPSKVAIEKMRDTFGYPGTGRLMLKDVSIYEAKDYKDRIEKLDGVDQVVWCDLTNSIYTSSEFIDYDAISDYYKDGYAVMDVTFKEGDTSKRTHEAIDEIEELVGDKGYIVGMAPTNKSTEETVEKEMAMVLSISVTLLFIILLLTTTSYFEPVIFLTVIGAAVALNKGTNIILGNISYITNNIMVVIQMATSMDYSIFLLDCYERERENGLEKIPALKAGLMATIRTVLASSLTTFFGFVVLVLMEFKIGIDLGVVMSKSIICSLLMVIFFMPALLLLFSDVIDKMKHRDLFPYFGNFAKVIQKISPYVLVVVLLLAPGLYITQSMNDFKYGPDATSTGDRMAIYNQTQEINERFGRSNLIVAIFPDEGSVKEKELVDELESRSYVKKVMGMSAYLPEGMFEDILPRSLTEMFHKDGYTRLLIYTRTKPESPAGYQYSDEIQETIKSYYGEENTFIAGNTPTTQDMQRILTKDYTKVNTLAIICIFLVVAISFKSPIIPIAAMIPIMAAIYLNMIFPYLTGKELIFIAYAVVSCVQLGSTIDYAILSIDNYSHLRKTIPDKKEAAIEMTRISFPSMLTSGGILMVCGYVVFFISTSPAIREVGHLIGRGAIFSVFFVTTLMPSILQLIDKFIVTDIKSRRAERIEHLRSRAQHRRERFRKLRENLQERALQTAAKLAETSAPYPAAEASGAQTAAAEDDKIQKEEGSENE